MSRSTRTPTDIEVTVLDLSDVEAEALAYLRAHAQTDIDLGKDDVQMPSKVRVGEKTGVVETPDGSLYAFGTEGVGSSTPISDENPLVLDVYITGYEERGDGFISMFPSAQSKLTAEQVRERMTDEKTNLADFIRTFGSRLDSNYESWRKLLAREGVATA